MNRLWYVVGVLLILAGLVHLGVFVLHGGGTPWEGPVSWRKPFTFGVSFGLSVLTLTWVSGFLAVRPRTRAVLLGAFALASTVEVALITLQAWRGVPSHFNMATAFDTAVARSLAAGGAVLVAIGVTMAVAAFRAAPGVAPSMRLAVRAGFATLLAAMAFGAVMIARGVVAVVTGDQQLAYTVATALKPAHAVFMHGVLLLPALAWLLARALPAEEHRLRLVRLATWTYVGFATAVSALAVAGLTPVSPSIASVICAGAVSGPALGALVLGRLRPRSLGRLRQRLPVS
ncbi:hypothetical protein MF672_004530 [Actinomadura sp. ATCC 31491]|uniref:DUF998 domain-containing protein n=1 Tax=Actinomadura luzonensis TaxID=2805427 RepID=A0ABT0FLA3_9ACTN|nr:hypothetical protein [Actinomadura luzonensis]MCK2213066.1 hypothetical protein [Actinomadura luzonensis]